MRPLAIGFLAACLGALPLHDAAADNGESRHAFGTAYAAYVRARDAGDPSQALRHAQTAHAHAQRAVGESHTATALMALNLADELTRQSRDRDRAVALYESALGVLDGGPHVPASTLLRAHADLATIYSAQSQVERAREHHERALQIVESLYGESHPATARRLLVVGVFEEQAGDLERAQRHYERALALRDAGGDAAQADVGLCVYMLGRLALISGRYEEAGRYYARALEIWSTRPPADGRIMTAAREHASLAAAHVRPTEIPAEPIERPAPEYPRRALQREVEGWVLVRFDIDATGAVRNVVVAASEPEGVFDRAAARAVESWRYSPRRSNGRPVPQPNNETRLAFVVP